MKYKADGAVHLDFHLATYATLMYVSKKHGKAFLQNVFRTTAQEVYRDIYSALKKGDTGPLIDHWKYYYSREKGEYEVVVQDSSVLFQVSRCPAFAHLRSRGVEVDDLFYLQITMMNDAWCENTPVRITTEVEGDGRYQMEVSMRKER